jgi:diazepam-binding inhibitor (GABA receptor modulating acyl-CoA-binding protein)
LEGCDNAVKLEHRSKLLFKQANCASKASHYFYHFPALGDFMSLVDQFNQAQADSKNLPERPDNMTLLKIYALFKQASAGDASGDRPGMTDFVARAKFDAWAELKGTSKDAAMQEYIDLIDSLKD